MFELRVIVSSLLTPSRFSERWENTRNKETRPLYCIEISNFRLSNWYSSSKFFCPISRAFTIGDAWVFDESNSISHSNYSLSLASTHGSHALDGVGSHYFYLFKCTGCVLYLEWSTFYASRLRLPKLNFHLLQKMLLFSEIASVWAWMGKDTDHLPICFPGWEYALGKLW